MRATLSYTMLRLLLLILAFGLLYLAGARSWLLLVLPFLLSGVASYFLLVRQRAAMAGAISGRIRSFGRQIDAAASAEDD